MKRLLTAALLLSGIAMQAQAVEWNGYARRLGVGHSAGYHVFDACPWMHTRHTNVAHSVSGFYYGGHPKYQFHSPNAGYYSQQWCQIAPFGPSYGGLQNYTPSAPYRGVYPLTGCEMGEMPVWSDVEQYQDYDAPAEAVEPADAHPAAEPQDAKPAVKPAPPMARKRKPRVMQTSGQPVVRPVR